MSAQDGRRKIDMETTTSIVQLGGLAAIFLFLRKLHADVNWVRLCSRYSRPEGV